MKNRNCNIQKVKQVVSCILIIAMLAITVFIYNPSPQTLILNIEKQSNLNQY